MSEDGLHRVLGPPGEIELGGKTFRLSPPRLEMRAAILQHLVQQRANPIEVLGQVLPKIDGELRKELIAEAIHQASRSRSVTEEDLAEYLNSWDGTCHLFFLMARPEHPELTLGDARELLAGYADERLLELWGKLDAATGAISDMQALGNSPGQIQAADPRAPG